jgi:hypothetical protein
MSPNIDLFIGLGAGMAFGFVLGVIVMSICNMAASDEDREEKVEA